MSIDNDKGFVNTDRELWREIEDDACSPSIHVTADGKIGINVGGVVYVKTIREWHEYGEADEWTGTSVISSVL